jgi:hypothetical protein
MLDHVLDPGNRSSMAAEKNFAARRVFSNQLGHSPGFDEVRNDKRYADVIVTIPDLLDEPLLGGKIEHGRGGMDVLGQKVQAEAGVIEAKRKQPLLPRDLIVKELHYIFFATIGVIHAVRAENGRKQHFHEDIPRVASLMTSAATGFALHGSAPAVKVIDLSILQ